MFDEIDLGSAPADEECAQVGSDDYHKKASTECRLFIRWIRFLFGEEPFGSCLKIKHNPHDFGTYLSVVIQFNPDDEDASEYAYNLEANMPASWNVHKDGKIVFVDFIKKEMTMINGGNVSVPSLLTDKVSFDMLW